MKKLQLNFNLPVSILKEDKQFVAYTPALDLSTSGNTLEEAQKNFNEAVNIFFAELMETGTLDEVLNELGWEKERNTLFPPTLISTQNTSFSIPCIN